MNVELIQLKPGLHGAHLRPGHFRPEVALMIQVVAEEAPDLTDHTLWVNEAWRPPGERPSYHPVDCAFDFDVDNVVAENDVERNEIVQAWAGRCRRRLRRPYYDVIAHDAGTGLHIHTERNGERPQ